MQVMVGRAPARVSLAGGGTDLPAYYERNGGAVVSFTVDLYATARVSPRISELELVSLDAGTREVIATSHVARRLRAPILAEEFLLYQKAVASAFGLERGRIAVSSEIPAGAGLASSGALCVALVHAVAALVGDDLDRAAVAERAASIEMDLLRRPCGKQDQYASAFGGLNLIEFFRDGSVDVTPLRVGDGIAEALERRIMLFHDGARRSAVVPLQEQARRSQSDPDTMRALDRLKEMAYETAEVLERGDLDRIGTILHEAWMAKQHLNSTVGSLAIARIYALARSAGAAGGKLAGAGMAGTLVVYCAEQRQEEVRATLAAEGWRQRPVHIEWEGAAVDAAAEDDHART